MKSVLRKIVSFTMALLLLASTTSWAVGQHFCMGHLVDVALFSEAETCGMQMDGITEDMEMDCCDDELVVIDGQEDLKHSFEEFSMENTLFLWAFTYSYINLFDGLAEQIVPHDDYPPPQLVRDIQLMDQVFLI